MTAKQSLRQLYETATPLYERPSAYFDHEANQPVANLFHRDIAGKCVLQVRGDYARDYAKALVLLPALLDVVDAAEAMQIAGAKHGPFPELEREFALIDRALAAFREGEGR